MHGSIAQLVEQRIENPRVAGSIPARATSCIPFRLKDCGDLRLDYSVRLKIVVPLLVRYAPILSSVQRLTTDSPVILSLPSDPHHVAG